MEESWYLFPGQTLQTTKIKDRGKALIATPAAWKKITDHLDKKKVQQQQLEEELEHRRYLKEGSKNMTKDWDNSIEKIRQRRFEEHERKIREREEDLINRFMELTAEQAEERSKIVVDARKRMFMGKQHSRTVNSSLLLTEVLHERNLQLEFDARMREAERVEEEKYAQKVKYNAEQERIENAEKKRKRKEIDMKNSEELLQQIKEIHDIETREKEERKAKEIEDHKRAAEELKAIQEYESLLDKNKKANVKQLFHDFAKQQKIIKDEAKAQADIEDKIVQICAKGKCRIETMKKNKDKETAEEKIKMRARLAAKIWAESGTKQDDEAQLLANAVAEYEAKQQEVESKKAAYQEKLRNEKIENRKQYLARKKEEEETAKEIEKWEMVNRLKNEEVFKEYNENCARMAWDGKLKYRKQLLQQIKEGDSTIEYDNMCKQADLQFEKDRLDNEDKAFFSYADEVKDIAKARGRTTEHIEKAVHNYKVVNELIPKKKNLSMLKSKVPINNENK